MSRSKNHGCGRAKCGLCHPEKKWPRKGAKAAQYEKPAVRRRFEVVCDETNNSPKDVAEGRIRIDVRLPTEVP